MTCISISGDVQLAVETLRTSHLLVQGASGSGKSYLLRVISEQLCQHVQTIVIDPEGEYHTLRGVLRIAHGREAELHNLGAQRPPRNTDEVLAVWRERISGGANKLLGVLIAKRGAVVSRDHAMQACEFAERTLTNYVSELSVSRLLVRVHGGIAANKEALFL